MEFNDYSNLFDEIISKIEIMDFPITLDCIISAIDNI